MPASPGASGGGAALEGDGLAFEPGRVVALKGLVIENIRECELDGPCYLLLRTEEGDCTVLYAEARGRPCPNEGAIRVGLGLNPGEMIEVQGRATGPARLGTCDSVDLYIKRIDADYRGVAQ